MSRSLVKSRIVIEFLGAYPQDAAKVLIKKSATDLAEFISHYKANEISSTLSHLPAPHLAKSLLLVEVTKVSEIIAKLTPNVSASIFRFWTANGETDKVPGVMNLLNNGVVQPIQSLLNHPNGTVGSLMNAVPFSLAENLEIREVLDVLRKERNKYSRYIYVTNSEGVLAGVLPFKDAFYADKDISLSSIMTSSVSSLPPGTTAFKALGSPLWKSWDSLPVTTFKGQLLGVIRYDVLEDFCMANNSKEALNDELSQAGAAVGEVFKIGLNATAASLGLLARK